MPSHRHNVSEIVPVPSSTPQMIIFPYDVKARAFSTSIFMPMQVQNRITLEEVEQFLGQVNVPIKQYYEKYGYLSQGGCGMICLIIICFYLFPLFIILMCWACSVQKKADKALREASEAAKIFIRDNSQQFNDRGLLWNIPSQFPRWIELWTQAAGAQPGIIAQPQAFPMMPQQPGYDGFSRPGIATTTMPQQNYQNGGVAPQQDYYPMQQNQYSSNMYNPNAFQSENV